MAQPLIANLPLDLVLASGYVIRFTALDALSGAAVGGVRATDVAFQVRPVNIGPGAVATDGTPSPLLVPTDETA